MPSGIYSWPTTFFETRAIFKRGVEENNIGSKRVTIPKREANYAGISEGEEVYCQVYDPVKDTKISFDATVRKRLRITIPKRQIPKSGIQTGSPCQFYITRNDRRSSLRVDIDAENLYPFVVRKVSLSVELNPNRQVRSTLRGVIPYEEISHTNPSGGEKIDIALIKIGTQSTGLKKAAESVPGRKRSVFRTTLTKITENSFGFSVPSVRRRLKGYNQGDELQLIGRLV